MTLAHNSALERSWRTIDWRPALTLAVPAAAWLLVVGAGLALRPPLPVDETRYLSVAWEMWTRGDQLVPTLNGAPYSHKPPLLFWIIQLGWALFGVSEMWARLVPSLAGLLLLLLAYPFAANLWPDDRRARSTAPLLLAGTAAFSLYVGYLAFDMLLSLMVAVGALGLWRCAAGGHWRGWILFALGLGGGILTKGPVAVLFLLPLGLLAPFWAPRPGPRWRVWYAALAAASVAGAALALAWALPAAARGGEQYASAILWGQTANRVVDSFAHARPAWWYLPVILALLAPWVWMPDVWKQLFRGAWRDDPGLRFCAVAFLVPLVLLSAVSGKQAHYLLPLLLPFQLAVARVLEGRPLLGARLIGIFLVAAGVGLGVLVAGGSSWIPRAPWLSDISPGVPAALAAGGLLILWWRRLRPWTVAAVAPAMMLLLLWSFGTAVAPSFSLRPVAAYLGQLERDGAALAHPPNYDGQYTFLGRLTRPLPSVWGENAVAWAQDHPDGRLVLDTRTNPRSLPWQPEFVQPYRGEGRWVVVWRAADVLDSAGAVLAERY